MCLLHLTSPHFSCDDCYEHLTRGTLLYWIIPRDSLFLLIRWHGLAGAGVEDGEHGVLFLGCDGELVLVFDANLACHVVAAVFAVGGQSVSGGG